MLCRLFDDLDVGTEARPVKPQQPPGQLTQIVTGGPNGELAPVEGHLPHERSEVLLIFGRSFWRLQAGRPEPLAHV